MTGDCILRESGVVIAFGGMDLVGFWSEGRGVNLNILRDGSIFY